ncbi:hypothetical protein FF36_04599 [Frankia torreyi]|uniref:Uncharacterized protein n=1 Tax=Frankia torreyi TaxID=1856 RepID=A0A0D8BAV6_9ACTN|nr:hypothetical protein FF36_04599 [Frankia torreyi]
MVGPRPPSQRPESASSDGAPAAVTLVESQNDRFVQEAERLLQACRESHGTTTAHPSGPAAAPERKRLDKAYKRLREAVDGFLPHFHQVRERAARLADHYPGLTTEEYRRAAVSLAILGEWHAGDAAPAPRAADEAIDHPAGVAAAVLASIARDGFLRLAFFVCPPTDYRRLGTAEPERYLLTHLNGSVLSRQVRRLRDLFRGLEAADIPTRVWAVVADTDEDDYLWRFLPQPRPLDEDALTERRRLLLAGAHRYLTEQRAAPKDGRPQPRVLPENMLHVTNLSAASWSPLSAAVHQRVLREPDRYFDAEDWRAEIETMRRLWRPGSYYEALPEPDETVMREILRHKFAAYAQQGVLLAEQQPWLVLIQTERPPELRTKMLNIGWAEQTDGSLPAVNFFGPGE